MELTSVPDLRTISVQYAQSLLQADKTLQDVQNITSRWPKNADADAHFLHSLRHSMNEHLQNISDHLNTVQYDEEADENPSLNTNCPAETSRCTIKLLLALLYICI
jgi:hypothetical protein